MVSITWHSVTLMHNESGPMHFEAINERGSVEKLPDNGRHRFVYDSDFYGSCTFTADIFFGERKTLLLKEQSIVMERYELKKGNVSALLNVSVTFFKRMLASHED